jgi:hypothetical protein
VFAAGSAGGNEGFAQRLAGAVEADGGVPRGDVGGFGKEIDGALGEVDGGENFAVGGTKVLDRLAEAFADEALGVGVRPGGGTGEELAGPGFEEAVVSGALAVMVDDGVAQDAVEPGGGRLVAANGGGLLEGAQVGGLQNVLRGGGVFYAVLQEAKKLAALGEQDVDGLHDVGAAAAVELPPHRLLLVR